MKRQIRAIDSGAAFGNLTVLGRDFEHEEELKSSGRQCRPYYKCRCECGNVVSIIVYSLLNGHSKSCGCKAKERGMKIGKANLRDLSGRIFGNIEVVDRDESYASGDGLHAYWHGKCLLCGSIKSFRGSDLTSGKVIDCGCMSGYRLGRHNLKDLTGVNFGHLTVIERDTTVGTQRGEHARWICRCDCGAIEKIASDVLTSYGKDRCSMCSKTVSIGEQKISELLSRNNICFQYNKSFGGCKYPLTGWSLRFDFVISNYDNCDTYIIEFDGAQHFKEVQGWESVIDLHGRIDRDNYKNEWCKENGIPLIRIPYTHLKDICIDDLLPSKTTFLI